MHRKARNGSGGVTVSYVYNCPNSDSYGEKFCKKKSIKIQDLEDAAEAALKMHLKLFLDTKEALESLNRTARAKQIKMDYRRRITETKNRQECAQS